MAASAADAVALTEVQAGILAKNKVLPRFKVDAA